MRNLCALQCHAPCGAADLALRSKFWRKTRSVVMLARAIWRAGAASWSVAFSRLRGQRDWGRSRPASVDRNGNRECQLFESTARSTCRDVSVLVGLKLGLARSRARVHHFRTSVREERGPPLARGASKQRERAPPMEESDIASVCGRGCLTTRDCFAARAARTGLSTWNCRFLRRLPEGRLAARAARTPATTRIDLTAHTHTRSLNLTVALRQTRPVLLLTSRDDTIYG